jgi:farnesyl diphosphate synthase
LSSTPDLITLSYRIARAADLVTVALDELLPRSDGPEQRLMEAMRYAALGPGKRLRPFFALEAAKMFDLEERPVLRAACALECIHAYSLVHDDLPCMDDDDLRRGKPTVHRAFDEATAVLAGDSLHALAFEILANPNTHSDPFVRGELVSTLALASGPEGMAGGQMMDIEAENAAFDLQTVMRLQALKTGALIAASVEMGAILGHIPPEGRTHLRGYARDIGLAFQIADDILDVEGDPELAGKALQKDAEAGKGTFVSLMGLDRAKQQAEMLVQQANDYLSSYGAEADLLRAIANYITERDR